MQSLQADLLGDRVPHVCCLLSKKQDRDHRVLDICCDSKCFVAFQQTWHWHGEMQFSIDWRWRSGSVGQALVSTPNYMYNRHMFSLWIVESLPQFELVAFHDTSAKWFGDIVKVGNLIKIKPCISFSDHRMILFVLLSNLWSLIRNAIFYIEFCRVSLIPESAQATTSCNIVANANTYFDHIFDRPSYFMI